jgi:hypothetical protein
MNGNGDEPLAAQRCPYNAEQTGTGPLVSRRTVLLGAATVAASPLLRPARALASRPATSATVAAPRKAAAARSCWSHAGGDARGSDIAVAVGRSKQGRFGLMFPHLKPFAPPDDLLSTLASQMVDPRQPMDDVSLSSDGDNRDIPSGYVYFGQFLDHDITRDTTPLTDQRQDPRALRNFDTPQLDLGSVYGRGPAQDPQLYEAGRPGVLLLVRNDGVTDLPRAADGTAFVGDPRNDENLIVCQLQIAFIRLHNSFMAAGLRFADAQRLTRWHYQWVVVNDFLPRMVGADVVQRLLVRGRGGQLKSAGTHYRPANRKRPMMPVEFSVAAYRFGHSMIRAEYEMHESRTFTLFGDPNGFDLMGSRPLRPDLRADWNYFFELPGFEAPDDRNFSRMIDTQVSLPLASLPATVVTPGPGAITALPERNLLRGKRLGLSSGQDVAAALGVTPLSNDVLGLTDPRWGGGAPLWFYILKESELLGGRRLGPVGGSIVAEVLLGLLTADSTSYFNARTPWAPAGLDFAMGDLLRLAGVA